jgi:hypothetical protein
MQWPKTVDPTLICIPLFVDLRLHLAWFDLELAVSVVSIRNINDALSYDLKRRFAIVD